MSETEIEGFSQKIVEDSKLGEFLWPAIKEALEDGEIRMKNGSLIKVTASKQSLRGFTTDILIYG